MSATDRRAWAEMVATEGYNRSPVIPQSRELVLGNPALVPPPMVARWPEAACPPRNQESFANENAPNSVWSRGTLVEQPSPEVCSPSKLPPFSTRENGTLVRTTE